MKRNTFFAFLENILHATWKASAYHRLGTPDLVDLAIWKSWFEYRKHMANLSLPKKEIIDLLTFREEVCDELLRANKSMPSETQSTMETDLSNEAVFYLNRLPPQQSVRFDKVAHWLIILDQKICISLCIF